MPFRSVQPPLQTSTIAKAGAMHDYFRGNAGGRNPLDFLKDREPIPAHYRGSEARLGVMDQQGLEKVFAVLREPYVEEPTNWSRRFKANVEKLASGEVIRVAEVVRDLSRRDTDKGLSAGEKRMLHKARHILVSELALAEKSDEDAASARLDEVLAS